MKKSNCLSINSVLSAIPEPAAIMSSSGHRVLLSNAAFTSLWGLGKQVGIYTEGGDIDAATVQSEHEHFLAYWLDAIEPEHRAQLEAQLDQLMPSIEVQIQTRAGMRYLVHYKKLDATWDDNAPCYLLTFEPQEVHERNALLSWHKEVLDSIVSAQSLGSQVGDYHMGLKEVLTNVLKITSCQFGAIVSALEGPEHLTQGQRDFAIPSNKLHVMVWASAQEAHLSASERVALPPYWWTDQSSVHPKIQRAMGLPLVFVDNDLNDQILKTEGVPEGMDTYAKNVVAIPLKQFSRTLVPISSASSSGLSVAQRERQLDQEVYLVLANKEAGFSEKFISNMQVASAGILAMVSAYQEHERYLGLKEESIMLSEHLTMLQELNSQSSQSIAWIRLKDFKVLYANPALSVLLGKEALPSDLLGTIALDWFHEESLVIFAGTALIKCIETGSWMGELRIQRQAGKASRWILASLNKVEVQGVDALAFYAQDITEQKIIQLEHERLVMVAERAGSLIMLLNSQGEIGWVNSSMCRAMERIPTELLGTHFTQWIAPLHHDVATQITESLRYQKEFDGKVLLQKSSGDYFWCALQISAANNPNDKRAGSSIVVGFDYTKQHQLEEQIESQAQCLYDLHGIGLDQTLKSEEKILAYLKYALDLTGLDFGMVSHIEGDRFEVMYSMDKDGSVIFQKGHVIDLNKTFCSLLSHDGELLSIDTLQDNYEEHPCFKEFGIRHFLGTTLEVGGNRYGSLALYSKQQYKTPNQWIAILVQFIAKAVASEISGLMSTQVLEMRVHEATQSERQKNHQLELALLSLKQTQVRALQKERMATLGALVAGIAHDLAGPIGNARLVSDAFVQVSKNLDQMLVEGTFKKSQLVSIKDRVFEASDVLSSSLTKAADLVMAFKNFSASQSRETYKLFDLNNFLEELKLTVTPTWRKTPHQIYFIPTGSIELQSYPGALASVLINLLSFIQNQRLKSVPNGRVWISTQIHYEDWSQKNILKMLENYDASVIGLNGQSSLGNQLPSVLNSGASNGRVATGGSVEIRVYDNAPLIVDQELLTLNRVEQFDAQAIGGQAWEKLMGLLTSVNICKTVLGGQLQLINESSEVSRIPGVLTSIGASAVDASAKPVESDGYNEQLATCVFSIKIPLLASAPEPSAN